MTVVDMGANSQRYDNQTGSPLPWGSGSTAGDNTAKKLGGQGKPWGDLKGFDSNALYTTLISQLNSLNKIIGELVTRIDGMEEQLELLTKRLEAWGLAPQ